MDYTVYILYSVLIDKFYVGYTNNIERRLKEHNRRKGKYTDRGIPWVLRRPKTSHSPFQIVMRDEKL